MTPARSASDIPAVVCGVAKLAVGVVSTGPVPLPTTTTVLPAGTSCPLGPVVMYCADAATGAAKRRVHRILDNMGHTCTFPTYNLDYVSSPPVARKAAGTSNWQLAAQA